MAERTAQGLYGDVRRTLLPRVLLPLVILGWFLMTTDHPTLVLFFLGLLLLTAVGLVFSLAGQHNGLAAWVLVISLLVTTMLAWGQFPAFPFGFLFVFAVVLAGLTAGILAPIITALACTGLVLLVPRLIPDLALRGMTWGYLASIWAMAYLTWISQRSQQRVVESSWSNYREAKRNLELLRDRQLELKRALEDLALANRETVRLNDMLTAAREAVEEARRSKEAFVANVSHELRTPLNMIIGFSDLILEAPEAYDERLPPALLADVASIRRNSEHLSQLVDDVLSLAETDTGRVRLMMEPTRIEETIREAVQAVQVLFDQKGLDLSVEIPDGLPKLSIDRTRIRQVILNILGNAGRFTQEGGAAVVVAPRGGQVEVSVTDTGPGIGPRDLERIFEPFWQGDPSIRRRYGGTGLGLAISKRFVEMHGGRIWVESEPGRGTTVGFALPTQVALPASSLGADRAQRWFGPYSQYEARTRLSAAPRAEAPNVLVVVEREEQLAELAARHLDDVEVIGEASLGDAVRTANLRRASAVLVNEAALDSRDGSDLRLESSLRELAFDIPLFSCLLPERSTVTARLGAKDYLTKPISRDRLASIVEEYVPLGGTVLVADDDDEARQLFGRMLEALDRDYLVIDAEDGQGTLVALRDRRPDLLLLDLVMPNVDGYEVLDQMGEEADLMSIPVVIISARDLWDQPLLSPSLTVMRPGGLSVTDLMDATRAVTRVLKPRFASQALPAEPAAS